MKRDRFEKMCRAAGMTPEVKETLHEGELFIADGFSARPGDTFRKFGATNEEYPFGAYCTIWVLGTGDDVLTKDHPGGALICDAFHDPSFDTETKKQARINSAVEEAMTFLDRREAFRAQPN